METLSAAAAHFGGRPAFVADVGQRPHDGGPIAVALAQLHAESGTRTFRVLQKTTAVQWVGNGNLPWTFVKFVGVATPCAS